VKGPELITLGCRLNIAESATIRGLLGQADDVVVVNSCAVTEEAVRQTRRAIRRAKRARPDAKLLVTGCAVEVDRTAFAAMREVDGIVANTEKTRAEAFRPYLDPTQPPRNAPPAPTHARAFLAVQNGCDHRCTFCIIPYGRGPSRSEPAGAVIERVRALVEAGHQEVVLTGVDLTSYGDLPGDSLGLLVERILRHVPELPRLRLSSLDPVEIDDRLFALITGEPRLMPHLHLSLQAGDDLILKRMRRRHLRADAVRLVERVKAARPNVAIGADLIAGFPTESEAAFSNSLAILDDCDIVFGHIFPYSPRQGTPAARMPQLETEVIRARASRLRAAAAARQTRWLDSLIGTRQRVLVELDGETGHAESFAKVRLFPLPLAGRVRGGQVTTSEAGSGPPPAPPASGRGEIMSLHITAREGDTLLGVPA
jgi:threonylcarbamoyladenosine tRNA methylthiotransferase MtaB